MLRKQAEAKARDQVFQGTYGAVLLGNQDFGLLKNRRDCAQPITKRGTTHSWASQFFTLAELNQAASNPYRGCGDVSWILVRSRSGIIGRKPRRILQSRQS